jgi:N-formylglutamate deformylase
MATRKAAPITVLHIPHSSRLVPVEERQAIRLDDADLNNELLRMTDAYTDELFPLTSVEGARSGFPVSRLVCDVERFPRDENEPMAARGMGAIYIRTSKGDVLRTQPVRPFNTQSGWWGSALSQTPTARPAIKPSRTARS